MSEEKFSVEVKTDGVTVSASGKASQRLAKQVADLISPFSEAFGCIGDHLRIYRQASVIRALKHAIKRADDAGIKLRPVHPKILPLWVEKASLEDDEELSKKWGNLLISSMGEFDSLTIWAANLLSEMGSKDALFLDKLYELLKKCTADETDNERYNAYVRLIERQNGEIYSELYREIFTIDDIGEMRIRADQRLQEITNQNTVFSFLLGFHFIKSSTERFDTPAEYEPELDVMIEVLCSKGLIQRRGFRGPQDLSKMKGAGHIDAILLTNAGLRFLDLVSKPDG